MRRLSRLLLSALVAMTLASASIAARAADEFPPAGTYKWKFFMPWGPGVWMSEPLRKFITEEVPKRTNGALQITWFYPGEHPYAYTDILLAIQEGAAQMGVTLGSYSGGLDSRLEAHELPFLFPRSSLLKYLEFLDVLQAQVWDPLLEKNWRVKIAAMQLHPPNQLLADVAVDKPNALAGKKIRSFGLTGNLWIESLGGTGVSIAYPEVATALATGTVDGAISSFQAMHGSGWMEHKKVLSLIDIFINPQWELVSLDAYDKLDPATRKAFDDAMADMQKMLREGYLIADYEALRDAELRLGASSSSPSRALREQMAQHAEEKIWPAWVGKVGKDGEAVLEQIIELRNEFDWK
jgi:TRAP-type transport system periplasmic protein